MVIPYNRRYSDIRIRINTAVYSNANVRTWCISCTLKSCFILAFDALLWLNMNSVHSVFMCESLSSIFPSCVHIKKERKE